MTAQSSNDYGKDMKSGKVSKGDYYCYFSTDVKDAEKRKKVTRSLMVDKNENGDNKLEEAVFNFRQRRPKKLSKSA